jgi:biotin carboxylase
VKSSILIVTGGLLQLPAVHIAHDLGLRVVVTDRDPSCVCAPLADEFVPLDIFDVAGHVALALQLKRENNLVAVFTEGADVARTVSLAAAACGLPCVDPRAAYRTNHKPAFRQAMDDAILPNVRWAEVRTIHECWEAVRRIRYPLIIKNTDSSASRGTTILREHDTLTMAAAFERAKAASRSGTALIEELMTPKYPGLEHTVETLMDGQFQHQCFITDRFFLPNERWAVEKGIQVPTQLTCRDQAEMFWLGHQAAIALGIDFGAAKFDMMWTPDGPRIIEVAARLSGGCECQWLDPLASGRDVIRCAMLQAMGEGIDDKLLQPKWNRAAVAHSIMPPPGVVRHLSGADEARTMPGIEHVFLRKAPGDVIPPYHDCVSRAGWIVASGDTLDDAWAYAEAAGDRIKIKVENDV